MGAGDDFGATLRDRLHAEFDPMPVREEGMARHCVAVLDEMVMDPDNAENVIRTIAESIRLTSQGGPVASIDVERAPISGDPGWTITIWCFPHPDA